MSDPKHLFARLCLEAVRHCGPDMAAIERFFAERMAGMDAETQAAIRHDAALVIAGGMSEGPQEELN